jgi:hypothetical protein
VKDPVFAVDFSRGERDEGIFLFRSTAVRRYRNALHAPIHRHSDRRRLGAAERASATIVASKAFTDTDANLIPIPVSDSSAHAYTWKYSYSRAYTYARGYPHSRLRLKRVALC